MKESDKMTAEGNNPTPQVQRVHDAFIGSQYTANFFAPLRPCKAQFSACMQTQHAEQQQQQQRQQQSELRWGRRWLWDKDLRWQQQQIKELLLEERMQLLQHSQLMHPTSLLAAYAYEPRLPPLLHSAAAADETDKTPAAGAAAAAAEAAATRSKGKPLASKTKAAAQTAGAAAATPDAASDDSTTTGSSRDLSDSSSDNCSSSIGSDNCSNSSSSSSSCSSCSSSSNAHQLIDLKRAQLFSRAEPLTAREIYAAVRCITDPEHPYTLEELMVVLPEYIKKQQQQQQQQLQQLQHWRRLLTLLRTVDCWLIDIIS
ncbi:hypothetical protein, conserved [Eimeria brunetti]|uniref:Uncharacterized protein n=1 Tax=Eimeria brunetti TaxID=51314 RepID=U6LB44_9EIME|nr:hypothetical protein, conserved [Eimeria brunetti]